jgi:hypothetical protein
LTKSKKLLDSELNVINLGLDIFFDGLQAQNVKAIQVDWKPVSKTVLDKKSEDILSKIL